MIVIDQIILKDQQEKIKKIVLEFDPLAKAYLFGPGTSIPGKSLDLYIKSQAISSLTRTEIKNILRYQKYMNNIEMVCEVKEDNTIRELSAFGIEI